MPYEFYSEKNENWSIFVEVIVKIKVTYFLIHGVVLNHSCCCCCCCWQWKIRQSLVAAQQHLLNSKRLFHFSDLRYKHNGNQSLCIGLCAEPCKHRRPIAALVVYTNKSIDYSISNSIFACKLPIQNAAENRAEVRLFAAKIQERHH